MRCEVVRYVLDENHLAVAETVLARAVGVDGLFANPLLPQREVLAFRGCSPELVAEIATIRCIVVLDSDRYLQVWDVVDPVVHAVVDDDVFVSASVVPTEHGYPPWPDEPAFRLFSRDDMLGECRAVDGFPRPSEGDYHWPALTLVGCEPFGEAPEAERCLDSLTVLDDHGNAFTGVPIALEVTSTRPSSLGQGLFDIVLDQHSITTHPRLRERPSPHVQPVWDLWRQGTPSERDLWVRFDTDQRWEWLNLTRRAFPNPKGRRGEIHHVHGEHATDRPGVLIALGEAVLGPGTDLGENLDTVKDLLFTGWSDVLEGTTLVWHDADVAHAEVRDYFVDLVELLRQFGIRVQLESQEVLDGVLDLDRRTALSILVHRWSDGWTKAAGLTSRRDYRSIRVQLDKPHHHEEWIVTDDAPDRIRWVIRRVAEAKQEDWLTVPTHSPDEVTAAMREAGLAVRAPETFMRRALADHPAPMAPDGYEISVVRGDVVEVHVLADGVEAASGVLAVVGEDAVPSRIETAPEHRRRGLGSVVMGVLVQEALQAGATNGLLCASDDGLHLYRRLGWEAIADVVVAHKNVPEEA